MSVASAGLRLSRAVVFAAVCGAVSAGGHVLAGGGPVPLWGGALGVLAALAAAYLIDGRERGPAAVLAATTLTQLALHQLFERLAPATGAAAHGHPAPGMALVHLTMAALTAWWLHRGERALWLMIRLYGIPLPVVGRPVVGRPVAVPAEVRLPPRPAPIPAGEPTPACDADRPAVTRRGPPPMRRPRPAS